MGEGVSGVAVIRATLRHIEIAVDLAQVSSVLTHEEAQGMQVIDPSPWLGVRSVHAGHVALVVPKSGPPVGVRLGQVKGVARWRQHNLMRLPVWVHRHLPDILMPGCAWDDGAIWLLDLDALIAAWTRDRRRDNEAMRRETPRR